MTTSQDEGALATGTRHIASREDTENRSARHARDHRLDRRPTLDRVLWFFDQCILRISHLFEWEMHESPLMTRVEFPTLRKHTAVDHQLSFEGTSWQNRTHDLA
jgi:hypothetical protein